MQTLQKMTDPDPIRDIPKLAYARRTEPKIVMINRRDYNKYKHLVKAGWIVKVY